MSMSPQESCSEMRRCFLGDGKAGFSLIEVALAVAVLTFGLLAAGQLIGSSVGSGSLARSKGTASMAAQSKIEYLAGLYRRDPDAADLSIGSHGPEQTLVVNPADGSVLDRYEIAWTLADVPDPRPGKTPKARMVCVTATPIRPDGSANLKRTLNKAVSIATILSPKTP